VLLVVAAATSGAQPPPAQVPGPVNRLLVFLQGRQIGTEQSTVIAAPDGWTVRGTGRLGNPIDLTTSRFEARYDLDWRPVRLEIDAVRRGQPMILRTTFAGGNATSELTQGAEQTRKVDAVSADPIVLPNMFFCAYEALAGRLQKAAVPGELRSYVAPQAEISLRLTASSSERIRIGDRLMAARRYSLEFVNPSGPVRAELWTDEDSRLLRFSVPDQGLDVAREEIAAVSARVETMGRANDEQVRMAGDGFTLAGTLSKPADAPEVPAKSKAPVPQLPAVILVPGSLGTDRDETIAGVPVFAQLANLLADAGYAVVRYDKRGAGQSGGREEAATVEDYARDAGAVVRFLFGRRNIDTRRIAMVGHGEGGLVAMVAASQAKSRVRTLVLLATPGTTGSDLIIEQQQHLLRLMNVPDTERQARIELQERIHHAVISGLGWGSIPAGYRSQADTPWFRSLLVFDPVKAMGRIPQPVLVVQGERDREVPGRHGELLLEAARKRKNAPAADLVVIDGVNHLFVPAQTGERDEYAALPDRLVSGKVTSAITQWLKDRMDVRPEGARR
jgi:pimeloyl-ACP methyl ester carboxylesterase